MRFFSETSYWNQKIPADAKADPYSDQWIDLLAHDKSGHNLGINTTRWTIPVYEVDAQTPRVKMKQFPLDPERQEKMKTRRTTFGHGPGFGDAVPIPEGAQPDPLGDSHMAVVDPETRTAWDMWGCFHLPDGSWQTKTGMTYSLDGDGVFRTEDFDMSSEPEGSIHLFGPSRAMGVPAIAGLIMRDDIASDRISHKLAFACRYGAFREFIYPTIWTDGPCPGGIPGGAILQLDPSLDLSTFDLLPAERLVAQALQEYGAVFVDTALGTALYAENLNAHPGHSWEGVLRDWDGGIERIPMKHYRILETGPTTTGGDGRLHRQNFHL